MTDVAIVAEVVYLNPACTIPALMAGISVPVIVLRHLEDLRLRGLADQTIYQRGRNLVRLEHALGKPLCDATAVDLAAWRAGLHVADETIIAYVSHVHEFYRWAHDAGLIDEDPAARLLVPKTGRRLPRPIGEAELVEAVQAAPPRIRPWLVLAGWAGFRAKEIALLRRTAVLETRRPRLLLVTADATKGRTERVVPMSSFVYDELVPVLPRAGWAFRRMDDRPGPNTPNLVSGLCNRYLHQLGIEASLHQLRHRFGTILYQVTKDLRLVQEVMGHAHPSTTAGYAAYSDAEAAAAVENLPAPGHLRVVSRDIENGV